jgi:hypothetical protein
MRALVVYESLFGNTRQVAEAVAAGLATGPAGLVVDCGPVDDPGPLAGADLVVAGGPTHALRLASRGTRGLELAYERRLQRILHRQSPGCRQAVGTSGLRTWLRALPPGHGVTVAAAFDTRMDARVHGGAAGLIARRLARHGYRLVAPPAGFTVEGVAGPLRAGELDRARRWGQLLAEAAHRSRQHARTTAAMTAAPTPRRNPMDDVQLSRTAPVAAPVILDAAPPPASGPTSIERRPVDLTRILITAQIVAGAVIVAYRLSGRPAAPKAMVTMGPGGWVSMKGGTVAVRRGSRPWGRPRPLPVPVTEHAPLWARVLSAVPLQVLTR